MKVLLLALHSSSIQMTGQCSIVHCAAIRMTTFRACLLGNVAAHGLGRSMFNERDAIVPNAAHPFNNVFFSDHIANYYCHLQKPYRFKDRQTYMLLLPFLQLRSAIHKEY
eukprot:scaffold37194_cov18-Prasinocladus_malaysianus.AAC.1